MLRSMSGAILDHELYGLVRMRMLGNSSIPAIQDNIVFRRRCMEAEMLGDMSENVQPLEIGDFVG